MVVWKLVITTELVAPDIAFLQLNNLRFVCYFNLFHYCTYFKIGTILSIHFSFLHCFDTVG